MLGQILPALLLAATAALEAAACTPPDTPLSNNISAPFAIRVQNATHAEVDGRLLNLWSAGGGDQHLYLSPAGNASDELTLVGGVLSRGIIHAVINGEYTAEDNTTKMFMTERGDPKALFEPIYGCDPATDAVQTELAFRARDTLPGGFICVRTASGDRYEFRYSPPGNPVTNPARPCIKVTLVVVPAASG